MSYVKNLDNYKEAMKSEFLTKYKEFLLDAFTEIAYNTPVDTGQAQSSWWITQEGQSMPDPKIGFGVPKAPSLYWMTWNNMHADLVNPNSYVIYLNEGWSAQAPPKFIEASIAKAVKRASQ